MKRACRDLLPRLRSPRGDEEQLASARAFVEWLLDDNYIFMGTVDLSGGPRRGAASGGRDRPRGLRRPHPPSRRLPRGGRAHRDPPPALEGRRPDHRARLLHQRHCHLPPRAHRGPDAARVGRGGEPQEPDRPPRPLLPQRLRPARRPHSHPPREAALAARALRGGHLLLRLAADPGHLQPAPQGRPALRRRRRPQADHRPHRARGERRGDRGPAPRGARPTRPSTWPSRGCATPTGSSGSWAGPSARPSAPWPSPPR